MGFKTFVEVESTENGVGDCAKNEHDGDDSKAGEISPCSQVRLFSIGFVHADKLEEEIGKGTKVDDLRVR